jgi:hypothetical protein
MLNRSSTPVLHLHNHPLNALISHRIFLVAGNHSRNFAVHAVADLADRSHIALNSTPNQRLRYLLQAQQSQGGGVEEYTPTPPADGADHA